MAESFPLTAVTYPKFVLFKHVLRFFPEGYIRLVQDMHQGATIRVKSKRGISEQFEVGIGLHQGSALSPFLFITLVDTISQDVRTELPWELLYADGLAIIDITSTDTQNRLESWPKVLTDNTLRSMWQRLNIYQQGKSAANESEWRRTKEL